ncbi:MAG: LLM class flavin-dependent oxidoreductase [Candidatus Tectomicrobia bacterium]|uniref:LLM class flavin-dependent oxidoreductase n=1 Tax=Tectimicrobiota bacterium TaxID=2528274 RepID=A0A932GNG0_UNCTE|nr:LLM class flavin-dependent oxidoreductase [Candidatus Tectomicrobia bacterium]
MAEQMYKIGFNINPRATQGDKIDAKLYIEMAERADRMGLCYLSVPDFISRPVPRYDALTYIAALSVRTKHVKIGTDVLVTPLRSPIELARRISTIDNLSDGRFIFGAGLGWWPKECEDVGISFKQRAGRTDEILHILKRIWTEPSVTHQGKYYQFRDVVVEPKPVQKPHPPIWIGGATDAAMRRTARIGDGWQGSLEGGHVGMEHIEGEVRTVDPHEPIRKLAEYARAEGRDPKSIRIAFIISCNINPDPKKAVEEGRVFWESQMNSIQGGRPFEVKRKVAVYGPAEELAVRIKELLSYGAERVVLYFHSFDIKAQVERLEKTVLPLM